MRLFLLMMFIPLLLSGCALTPTTQTYTGVYAEGLETMTFHADGQSEPWSVAGGAGVYALQAAVPPIYSAEGGPRAPFRVRATIRGEVSGPGRYGHLGLFRREISITDVVEVSAADAN